jgi:hypothetical protein
MMKYILLTIVLSLACSMELTEAEATEPIVSIFYCGFGGDYCGQSTTDDVNPAAKFVILAFANTQPDGSIIVDNDHFPTPLITNWKKNGKKVILSVGGQNGNWNYIFASPASVANFI